MRGKPCEELRSDLSDTPCRLLWSPSARYPLNAAFGFASWGEFASRESRLARRRKDRRARFLKNLAQDEETLARLSPDSV
jgi:hypothetical protein